MTNTAPTIQAPRWRATVEFRECCVPFEERVGWGQTEITFRKLSVPYVVLRHASGDSICFRINIRRNRPLSFTDPREEKTGTGGSSGIWGTRPTERAGRRRSLTPSSFIAEVSRFIGTERAVELVRLAQE